LITDIPCVPCVSLEFDRQGIELTPKPLARTTAIMGGLLVGGYAQVIYLTAPAARPVVERAAAGTAGRIVIRDLPAGALPEAQT
jgi:hypothetical protein